MGWRGTASLRASSREGRIRLFCFRGQSWSCEDWPGARNHARSRRRASASSALGSGPASYARGSWRASRNKKAEPLALLECRRATEELFAAARAVLDGRPNQEHAWRQDKSFHVANASPRQRGLEGLDYRPHQSAGL